MAKKKSQKIELSLILRVAVLILGIVTICFGFLDGVKFTLETTYINTEELYTSFEVMFGKEDVFAFSFMTLLAFILPLAGGVLMLFKNKILNIAGIICFVVGAVFLFLVPNFIVFVEESAVVLILENYTRSLAVGTILSAIMAILGAIISAYVTFFIKK